MNIAVILAGGTGQHLSGEDRPKQFLELAGKPVIIRTLRWFDRHPQIDAIVIACVQGWTEALKEMLDRYRIRKVKKIVPGGETGQLSICHALCGARELSGGEPSVVLIHDAVRPLINDSVITRNIRAVRQYGSAVTVSRIYETVLVTDGGETVAEVPDKKDCRFAQAPQSFWLEDLLQLHDRARQEGKTDFVDSCSLMQYYRKPLHLVEGPEENRKITTRYDLYAAEGILRGIKEGEPS